MKVKPLLLATLLAAPLATGAPAAISAAPRVVTDIPPVHSLVAMVMAGVGEPELLLPPGASPHSYAMRPSEAARLQAAEIVFWIGEGLTPWLEPAIDALAGKARVIELMEAAGVRHLEFRQGATFEAHEHDDDDDDDHSHNHGHSHGHAHSHDHEKKAEAAGHDGHDHGAEDPHVWLDPLNAAAMLSAMADALAEADPANAAAYLANAQAARAMLAALTEEIAAKVAPALGKPFVVFHDAYHYFEARFDIEAAGAISLSDASAPGPQRLEEVRGLVRDLGVVCVFAEPQFDPKVAALVVEGAKAEVAVLDPLGASLTPGAGLYPALMRDVAGSLTGCLTRAM